MTLYDAYIILCEDMLDYNDLHPRRPRKNYSILINGKEIKNIERDARRSDSGMLWERINKDEHDYFPKNLEIEAISKSETVKISNAALSS